jgi:ribosome-associated toxin RatA of RatAB toxin-antitoxin module
MPRVERRAHVPYTTTQMFDLVNDVDSYPQFLHWCRDARVASTSGDTVEAVIDIGLGGIHKSFRTRNTIARPHRIGMTLVSGPFRHLDGSWEFAEAANGGTDVTLALDYEVSNSPLAVVFSAVFEEVARSQMNAFVARARRLYG